MGNVPLRDAFTQRKDRFCLLAKGFTNADFTELLELLEIGCAGGEAVKYLSARGFTKLTAIDVDSIVLEHARTRVPACRFICADACRMPFADESFDGIFSEAAFSVIPDKAAAAAEYARVLRKGGRFLMNDFALREAAAAARKDIHGIPCLEGVQTAADYIDIFRYAGFKAVYRKEEYPELVRIAASLSHYYGIPIGAVGSYIQRTYGNSKYVNEFFKKTKMSYYQIIFEKE